MNLKQINSLGQKLSKLTKVISDVNAVNELTKGNARPAKRKVKNKLRGLLK